MKVLPGIVERSTVTSSRAKRNPLTERTSARAAISGTKPLVTPKAKQVAISFQRTGTPA